MTPTEPAQGLALAALVKLQAAWENTPKAVGTNISRDRLQAKQRAFEAFRSRTQEYNRRFTPAFVPERQGTSDRYLAVWCRHMARLFAVTTAAPCPVQVVEKAYRWAERAAAKGGREPEARTSFGTTEGAVHILGMIAQWCEQPVAAFGLANGDDPRRENQNEAER
jgi:hypothetical protein